LVLYEGQSGLEEPFQHESRPLAKGYDWIGTPAGDEPHEEVISVVQGDTVDNTGSGLELDKRS
jgi:hypothetical protein